jgi:chitinase
MFEYLREQTYLKKASCNNAPISIIYSITLVQPSAMKYNKHLAVAAAFLVLFAGCSKKKEREDLNPGLPVTPPVVIQAPPAFGYYVVGYLPSYRTISDIPDVKFRMCNVVNYAFFSVNSSGLLTVPASPATTPAALIAKARANNAKVFMSINDGAAGNFKSMASTAAGRNSFITDVMNKVRQYGFDGVDVDWEFPNVGEGTDITFTALMKELSDSLHRDAKYYLTAAITAGKYAGGNRDAIKSELFNYVDFFNIMAYDDFGNTPFRQHSDYNLAVTCLNYWLNTRAMPKSKCVLGFPAYGRPDTAQQNGNILTYRDILFQGGSSQSDSATVTSTAHPAPYRIYYNGQPTVKKKAIYAKQNANGVMMWEKWQDAMDANSLLKAACDTVGRTY